MAINFNELPDSKPNALLDKGRYKAKVLKAEMKKGKDLTKPEYLNLTLQTYDAEGKELSKIFDMITEPTSEVARFKVKRFVIALQVPLETFELKDLTKFAVGKEFYVDITIQPGTGTWPDKNVVDVFAGDIYYTESDTDSSGFDEYIPGMGGEEPEFNAPDAEDAAPAEPTADTGGPEY